ncbi:hypothetical protein, partial [Cellulomonas bogoriensis]|uniref:hypothetical protein n=1 Tax=Cellulomonas bogoriensis TaxID=301388 RepID=UPI001E4D5334
RNHSRLFTAPTLRRPEAPRPSPHRQDRRESGRTSGRCRPHGHPHLPLVVPDLVGIDHGETAHQALADEVVVVTPSLDRARRVESYRAVARRWG